MNGVYTELDELESLADMLEAYDDEDYDSSLDERSRRGRRVRTATGRNLYQPRPQASYVTQAQLQAAMARVGAQIKTNSDALASLNTKTTAIGADLKKQAATMKKETESLKRSIQQSNQAAQMAALLPALTQKTATITTTANGLTKDDKVILGGDSLGTLLPLLMFSGTGSMGGGFGGSGQPGEGTQDNTMMMLALVLALRK